MAKLEKGECDVAPYPAPADIEKLKADPNLNVQEQNSFMESLVYGMGSALGFTLVMVLFAGIRERHSEL